SNPPPVSICGSESGPACEFDYLNPTVATIVASCPSYPNPLSANTMNAVYSACFTFTALNTDVQFNDIIISNCVAGNIIWVNWEIYNTSCTIFDCGTLSNLSSSGLTCNADYTICYTYEIPSCTHTLHYPFLTFDGTCAVPPLLVTASASDDSICPGECINLSASASGGNGGPYSYSWTSIPVGFSSTDSITSLVCPDVTTIYIVQATDGDSIATDSVTVVVHPAPIADAGPDDSVSCADTVNLLATATGGALPYTYQWTGGPSTANYDSVGAGMYIVTVTDSIGESSTATVVVNQPFALSVNISSTPVTCPTCNDGTATVQPNGGSGSYTYLWDDSLAQTTATATGLAAGQYNVTVTDSLLLCGDTIIKTVTVDAASNINGLLEPGGVKIYPNPSQGYFTIEFTKNDLGSKEVFVYNILGNLIKNIHVRPNERYVTIDMFDQSNGMYFIKVTDGDSTVIRKIVIRY
ncbi:MAG: T9SS type A sorting domain-containing protein, partial [Bacteroidetes bacterium]|nr:T9SS type A sorting domain-containing protein [Bacteroidota bacterium]